MSLQSDLDGTNRKFVEHALEASVYVEPRNHGLTPEELVEIGSRVGRQRGGVLAAIEYLESRHELERVAEATSRALLKFGGGSSDSYATVRAGASTFFVSFDV